MLQLDDPTTSCLSTKHLYATWSNFIRFSRFERFASYHQFLLPISLGMLDLLRICYMVCNVTNDTSLSLSLSLSLFLFFELDYMHNLEIAFMQIPRNQTTLKVFVGLNVLVGLLIQHTANISYHKDKMGIGLQFHIKVCVFSSFNIWFSFKDTISTMALPDISFNSNDVYQQCLQIG